MDAFHSGIALAALSAVFNGSFGVLTKLPKARIVPPLIMTYWLCEGVVISGAVVLAFPPRVFTLWGLLSGIVFVVSSCFSVTAINLIGVSAATGVWCGVAAACSFAWGVLVAGEELASVGKALLALALILAGMAGIALAAWAGGGAEIGGDGEDSRHGDAGAADAEGMREDLLRGDEVTARWAMDALTWQQRLSPAARMLLGLASAVLAGVFGGLILAPMLAGPSWARGIQFVPSFALGVLLAAPLSTLALTCTGHITFTQATSSRAALPGMCAGVLWSAGNVASIAAVTNPAIGLAVAMPIMQCGLFVAGIWGILLFKEIQGVRPLATYFASGAVLIAGAALLAAAKQS